MLPTLGSALGVGGAAGAGIAKLLGRSHTVGQGIGALLGSLGGGALGGHLGYKAVGDKKDESEKTSSFISLDDLAKLASMSHLYKMAALLAIDAMRDKTLATKPKHSGLTSSKPEAKVQWSPETSETAKAMARLANKTTIDPQSTK